MDETRNVAFPFENIKEMVEQLRKSLDEMDSHRDSLTHGKSLLEDIIQHSDNIKKSQQQKFVELETKERALEEKQAECRALLAEKETSVVAKEQDLLNRLQELKDAAVSAILETHEKYKASLENKVSISVSDHPNASSPAPDENIPVKSSSSDAMSGKVKLHLQVKQLCEQMNAEGLLKLVSDNRKILVTLHDELPVALRGAKEPAHLVLNAIEAFYPQYPFNFSQQLKDNNLQVLRRTCLLLLESAAPLLGMPESGSEIPLSFEIKQRAKRIADEWKAKLDVMDLDASNGYSLEALAFLQLLVTFCISSEFDEEELCKFVVSVSRHRKQAPEVCRALGLAHKTRDVTQALVSKGRQIDAAYFSHIFQLTEIFPLEPLLKQYLEDAKKNIGHTNGVGAEMDTTNQELVAMKAVIKFIENFKLQEAYPLDTLQTRVMQIEKSNLDKKRASDYAPPQRTRPSGDGVFAPHRPSVAVNSRLKPGAVYGDRGRFFGARDHRYHYASPPVFAPPYGQRFTAPRPYHYQDERVPPPYVAPSNYGGYIPPQAIQSAPANYENYTVSGTQQPAPATYGSHAGSNLPPSHPS
ncbi:Protein FRIGIDA [Platanthera guangdongensis]|uniref:FRIGIDA-like protein n=1 Tax=Platanthera guangdongensis TaxID=2320717 RepID=A0ABR2LJV1_9ASPA